MVRQYLSPKWNCFTTVRIYFSPKEMEQIEAKAGTQPLADFCYRAALNYNRATERSFLNKFLRYSSTFFVFIGGILLASNIPVSKYGFIFLALSSSQFLIASILSEDWEMVIYFTCIFLFVDSLGVIRWVLN